ncbi:MAG: hypothetical protein GC168_15965 [Candidatus Hydrogenedens sp.]|nr:hypothetical protein [Candidatus Hydrogenedens sp.]
MNAKKSYAIMAVLIALLLAAGAMQNERLRWLRESKAFYSWIQAAATNERILGSATLDYNDSELFDKVAAVADTALAGTAPAVSVGQDSTLLEQLVADAANNDAIWAFAKSDQTAGLRDEFLSLARKSRLNFARNLEIADLQANQVSLFNAFFGFRKIAANLLWIQVDREWRLGQMYRIQPMLKTVTVLDPNFVKAYLIGGWHIAYNVPADLPLTPPSLLEWSDRYKACVGPKEAYWYEAAEFLKDGIRNNPRNYELYFDLGFAIYDQKIEDYNSAVLYLKEAVRQPHELWVPRMLNLAYEKNGQYEESLAGWQEYQKNYPQNFDTASRFITRCEGLIEEQKGQQLRAQASESADASERERLLSEAAEHDAAARAKYTELNEAFGEGRLLIMDAEDLRAEKRYYEAIAKLEVARKLSGQLFVPVSDMIIQYKEEGGIPLNVSERKQVLREAEAACKGMPDSATGLTGS